jgi:uncharacterized membrane protein
LNIASSFIAIIIYPFSNQVMCERAIWTDNPSIEATMANLQKLRAIRPIAPGVFAALAVALRIAKNVTLGPVQIVNFPAIFTIIGGLMFGAYVGAFTGFISFFLSDVLLGYAGTWTIITSLSMALIGGLSPLLRRLDAESSAIGLGVSSYILILVYDILSSMVWLAFVTSVQTAFVLSVVGLFLPSPLALYPVGLVTEIVTVLLIVLIYPHVKRAWGEVKS